MLLSLLFHSLSCISYYFLAFSILAFLTKWDFWPVGLLLCEMSHIVGNLILFKTFLDETPEASTSEEDPCCVRRRHGNDISHSLDSSKLLNLRNTDTKDRKNPFPGKDFRYEMWLHSSSEIKHSCYCILSTALPPSLSLSALTQSQITPPPSFFISVSWGSLWWDSRNTTLHLLSCRIQKSAQNQITDLSIYRLNALICGVIVLSSSCHVYEH